MATHKEKPEGTREASWQRVRCALTAIACLGSALAVCGQASAQSCKPVSQRTGELGCWITVSAPLGQLPQRPIFWHLDTYPTRIAAEAAKGARGTVVARSEERRVGKEGRARWQP